MVHMIYLFIMKRQNIYLYIYAVNIMQNPSFSLYSAKQQVWGMNVYRYDINTDYGIMIKYFICRLLQQCFEK